MFLNCLITILFWRLSKIVQSYVIFNLKIRYFFLIFVAK